MSGSVRTGLSPFHVAQGDPEALEGSRDERRARGSTHSLRSGQASSPRAVCHRLSNAPRQAHAAASLSPRRESGFPGAAETKAPVPAAREDSRFQKCHQGRPVGPPECSKYDQHELPLFHALLIRQDGAPGLVPSCGCLAATEGDGHTGDWRLPPIHRIACIHRRIA